MNEGEWLSFQRRIAAGGQTAGCMAFLSLLPYSLEGCSASVTLSSIFAGRNETSSCTLTWHTRALPVGTSIGMPGLCGISSSRASTSSCHSPSLRTWDCTVSGACDKEIISSRLLVGSQYLQGLAASVFLLPVHPAVLSRDNPLGAGGDPSREQKSPAAVWCWVPLYKKNIKLSESIQRRLQRW